MIVKSDEDMIRPYLTDASNFKGGAEILFIPENFDELKQAIEKCYTSKIPITISGAGTGLTGGRVPLSGAVISLEKLNQIINIDYTSKIAKVMPGVLLSDLEKELNAKGYFYPPNPTEKNSSIGGNVANNSSGARTFKYGSTRNFVEGLRLLTSEGEELYLKRGVNNAEKSIAKIKSISGKDFSFIIPNLKMPEVKNSAGYYLQENMDMVDLFIGSEGTLGIYEEIELSFLELPECVAGGIAFFDDEVRMLKFVNKVKKISRKNNRIDYRIQTGIASRVIELFDRNSLNILQDKYSQIPKNAIVAIWFEQEYSHINEVIILDNWYNIIKKHTALADNTWFALNDNEHEKLREFRHELPLRVNELIALKGRVKLATDSAVPDESFETYYHYLKNTLIKSGFEYAIWGHIGNNHIHANIFYENDRQKVRAKALYENCLKQAILLGGTISAEHGIGKIKKEYLRLLFGESIVEKMKAIKKVFDPCMLLNQGNLFD